MDYKTLFKVVFKLDQKKKCRNAFYFLSIERVIMDDLEVDDYFNMRISDKEISITSNNEAIINMLKELRKEVEDEND